jgi:hypothetical protein
MTGQKLGHYPTDVRRIYLKTRDATISPGFHQNKVFFAVGYFRIKNIKCDGELQFESNLLILTAMQYSWLQWFGEYFSLMKDQPKGFLVYPLIRAPLGKR